MSRHPPPARKATGTPVLLRQQDESNCNSSRRQVARISRTALPPRRRGSTPRASGVFGPGLFFDQTAFLVRNRIPVDAFLTPRIPFRPNRREQYDSNSGDPPHDGNPVPHHGSTRDWAHWPATLANPSRVTPLSLFGRVTVAGQERTVPRPVTSIQHRGQDFHQHERRHIPHPAPVEIHPFATPVRRRAFRG